MYIVPSRMFKAMKKDVKNILLDSINIRTHNVSNTIIDYYMRTCVSILQVP
jgi:hypothetical protein